MFDRFYKRFIPPAQRPVVRSHPLAVWFSLGIFLYGFTTLIFEPPTVQAETLPHWQALVFRVAWMVGGGMSWFGIIRGKSKFEAAGMILLATGLLVNFIATLKLLGFAGAWPAGLFILPLAVGCFRRALYLVSASNGGPDGPELIP